MSNVSELLEYDIYPCLDRAVVFQAYNPQNKGAYLLCDCPDCGKREAYIYHDGVMLICNRNDNCGYKISIWDHVQRKGNLSNQETLYELARLAGVPLSEKNSDDYTHHNAVQRKAYILETIRKWATDQLFRNVSVQEYLAQRGFTRREDIKQAGLGFIPSLDAMKQALIKCRISYEELHSLGLLSLKWESHPLIGLWHDRSGQPRTMWGRCLGPVPEGEVKYYLLPGEKSKASPYMLHRVTGKEIVIVEGFLDALVPQFLGDNRVVAIIGVYITQDQLSTLQRTRIKRAILCLDPDLAGENGMKRNIDNLAAIGIQSYVVTEMPNQMDPDEFILQYGIDQWRQLINQARRGVSWKTQKLFEAAELTTDIGKDQALEEFMKFVSGIKNPIEYEEAFDVAASQLKISSHALHEALQEIMQKQFQENLKIRARHLLRQGQDKLFLDNINVGNVLQEIREEFSALSCTEASVIPASLDVSHIKVAASIVPEGKATGYPQLDEIIAIMPSELTIIGARPRHGKTSFACNLLMNWARLYRNDPFLFFSYEVSDVQLFFKLVSLLTSCQHNERQINGYSYRQVANYLRTAKIAPNKDIEQAIETLKTYEHQLFLVTDPSQTIEQLVAYSQAVKKEWGKIGAILIDYIELVRVPEAKSEELRIAYIVNQLRIASQALDTPIVALAQMNRSTVTGAKQIKKIDTRRPVLEGLRYSGRQEQEAFAVLGLFNRYIESTDVCSEEEQSAIEGSVTDAPFEVITLKNRYGESNKITEMSFNMITGNIAERR